MMRWIENVAKADADTIIKQYCIGWTGRMLVTRDPKPTDEYSAEDLKSMGLTGIYELRAGRAVS
jgi:hypothetical protein